MSEQRERQPEPVRQTRAERLNTALYKKMFAAQEKYRAWLLSLPSEEILNHAYEYTMREDIVLSLEDEDIGAKRAVALLMLPDPLSATYHEYEKMESTHMKDIFSAVEQCADGEIKKRRKQKDEPER